MQAHEASTLTLDSLVHSYYPAVVRLALSILADGSPATLDEAEDAAQETFIAAANALGSFHGGSSLKTWLFAIAINTCRSRLRRRKAQRALAQTLANVQRLFGGTENTQCPAQSPERATETAERDRELWNAVDSLDEKHRLVVLLRYVHELPVTEIARALEVNEGTIHSRLHYARQQLARQLRRSLVFQEVGTR